MSEAKASTTVKYASLGLSAAVVVVGAVMWLTTVQNDGKHNTSAVEQVQEDISIIKDDVGDIKTDIAVIKKALERNQSLTRNP